MTSQELNRPLAMRAESRRAHLAHFARRVALVAAVLTLVALVVSRVDFARDMRRLDVRMLSGDPQGGYHALVDRLSGQASRRRGKVANLTSAGSAENVGRLLSASQGCEVAFALAQDGSDWGDASRLELVGRLPHPESVLVMGTFGHLNNEIGMLKGKKVGIGPLGSGTARLGRQIFEQPDVASVGIALENHPLAEQADMVRKGTLDLGLFVIDADAPFVAEQLKNGLSLVGFAKIDALDERIPHLRMGRIPAGKYDLLRPEPLEDLRVLQVDTLVLGNRCAGRSATVDLLMLLAAEMPDFIRHNKETANASGVELAPAAREFFDNEGPQAADQYAPWLVDVMPPANWAYVVMAVSLLFNAMGAGHRFRLWRIDAARVELESSIAKVFGTASTLADIQREPAKKDGRVVAVAGLIEHLEQLAARSRRYSLSVLVPMGQEMAYRYQEGVIYQTLAVLRDFQRRADAAEG